MYQLKNKRIPRKEKRRRKKNLVVTAVKRGRQQIVEKSEAAAAAKGLRRVKVKTTMEVEGRRTPANRQRPLAVVIAPGLLWRSEYKL